MEDPELLVTQSTEDLVEKLADIIQRTSDEAINERDVFYIGISGGSMINYLKEALLKVKATYNKWKIFFNDERVVPLDSDDSTFGACRKNLIGVIEGLTEDTFVVIKENVSVEDAAAEYMLELIEYFRPGVWPRFDLLLLGLGEDGHTCSLFPGHPLLTEKVHCVGAVRDSPKPPPKRITFTFPILNSAAFIVFVATGEGKAKAIKGVLVDKDETLPAFHIQPRNGKITWIMDEAAANLLPHDLLK